MKNDNTTKTTKTTQQLEVLQTKAQAIAQTLNKQVIIASKGEQQHIKVELGYVYEITKDGEFLDIDSNLIAKKAGNDLELLLENDTVVIFDNYFEVCDSSCFVSLPSKNGVYYVVDKFTTLADGSQIVYFYGNETTLSAIADNQSSFFAQSFSDAFSSLGGIGFFSFLAGIGIAAGGDGDGQQPPPIIPPPQAVMVMDNNPHLLSPQ